MYSECRFDLTVITDFGITPPAASGDLPLSVNGSCYGMQNEIHALAWRRGEKGGFADRS